MRRSRINPISKKKRLELEQEKKLSAELFAKQKGKCYDCGKPLGWGSALHHIIFRSHGGKTDAENCVLLCLSCHMARHHIRLGKEG